MMPTQSFPSQNQRFVLLLALLACGDKEENDGAEPTLTLQTPTEGQRFNAGEVVEFTGTVTDDKDQPDSLLVEWRSDLDGVIATTGADSAGTLSVSIDSLQAGDHEITVTATDTDGMYSEVQRTLRINAVPTAPSVELSPRSATTTDELIATATGATDPDESGPIHYSYVWTEDGIELPNTSETLPASSTQKGRTYRVTVTPHDDYGGGEPAYAELTVENSAPRLDSLAIEGGPAVVGATLACVATASDPDDDLVTLSFQWHDGTLGPTYNVSPSDDPGAVVTCSVTAEDGSGGAVAESADMVVTNSAPEITDIRVSPTQAKVGETLTCNVISTDADGEAPVVTYAWPDGSTARTYVVTNTTPPGDPIVCEATAADADGGSTVASASATVENSDPVVDSIAISPFPANNDDTLACIANATDADAGTPLTTYAWSGSIAGSLGTAPTLDLSTTNAASGETITCLATATDTAGGTGTNTADITLENRPPTVILTMRPTPATRNDTLTCTAAVADDDGDSMTSVFSWTVNGNSSAATYTTSSSSTLTGAFAKGEEVLCAVTTTDSNGASTTESTTITIANTAPALSAVFLSPGTAYTNDTLTVSYSVEDVDGDVVSVSFDWYVDGNLVQSGSDANLNGSSTAVGFDKNSDIYAIVTATDGLDTTSYPSPTLTVANAPPHAPVVAITPDQPVEGEDLVCAVLTGATDDDGDDITYSMTWTVDGVPFAATSTQTWPGDTVPGAAPLADEEWECTATPDDGDDEGTPATEATTIGPVCGDGAITDTVLGIDFVTACGGTFDIGCTAGQASCRADESPVMPVTLTHNYDVSQTEITQGQFESLMGYNLSGYTACGTDCPVEQVSWHMAAAFANMLSFGSGLTQCYSCSGFEVAVTCTVAVDPYTCDGFRLLTEAEWEGAARCGEDTLYAGSNTVGDVAWYDGNSVNYTQPVAGLDPNACGLYDMSGNVYEWVHDAYDATYYDSGGRIDPTGSSTETDRVFRGGAHNGTTTDMRVAARNATDGYYTESILGFRVGRTANQVR